MGCTSSKPSLSAFEYFVASQEFRRCPETGRELTKADLEKSWGEMSGNQRAPFEHIAHALRASRGATLPTQQAGLGKA